MTRDLRELESQMTEESFARIRALANALLNVIVLNELREAREMTQTTLMNTLQINLLDVLRIERRTDLYISTLDSYVKTQGGSLEICAVFPHGTIRINQFADLAR